MTLISRFIKNESGATAIEYALIAALVGVAIIAALNSMTGALKGTFGKVQTELNTASGSGS